MQKRILFLVASLLVITMQVMAQVTTSSMSGKITLMSSGETAIGATVIAVHEPSGTQYASVSNVDGRFNIQGMRVGGPYRITVSYIGYATRNFSGIQLALGENYSLNVTLAEDESMLDEVVVSGRASRFAGEKTGASTNLTNAQIMEMPTVSRSLTDFVRMSPYANGMSMAGGDGRSTNFRLDGADFNNNFGLSSSLPGGGTPISMDAIEEMQMSVSPFDVRETNFVGGTIHAVTKSGTNTFKGTAYIYYNNENMHGNRVDGTTMADPGRDRLTTYGFTLGGPILKDKLFFFANYEHTFKPTVVTRWRASDDGVANPTEYISRTKKSDMETVRNFLAQNYGYDTGSYTDFPADENNDKYLMRLDWNITNNHHLALRFSHTINEVWNTCNNSSADVGTRFTGNRISQYSMAFANNFYSMDNKITSFSADLNSRFNNNMSNQLIVTYSDIRDERGSNSAPFPHIDIMAGYETSADGTVTQTLEPYMSLGYELFTWKNAVKNQVFTINENFTYYLGAHKLTAGLNFEHQMALNAYMRNGTGYYRYRSLDDFLSGAAPESVALTYGYFGDKNPAAEVNRNQYGLYVQDEWNPLSNLKITGGIRFDNISYDNDDIMRNNAIYDVDFNGRRVDTGKWPDTSIQVSPRLGFNWDVFGDKSLTVRGGTGLFTGRLPLVFFTNMPTNSGMVQYQAQLNAKNGEKLGYSMEEFKGGLVTDGSGHATIDALYNKLTSMKDANGKNIFPTTVTPEDGTVPSSISAVDPDFKLPQVWKSSIAVDYQIPVSFPFTATAEFIYNKMVNDVCISDWSMMPAEGFARWNGADNRPIYPTTFRQGTKAFILENTSRGYNWQASLQLNAQPFEWLNLMAAYTHSAAKEVTSLPGSAAESAFTYIPTYQGPNNIMLHNSQNLTPDRFVASATLNDKSGNHYSLIYETYRGGYKYSYMLSNDMNGDGYSYDALYIPTDDQVANNQFRFASESDKQRFMEFVHNDDYLSNHQGDYAEGYSVYSPWVHRLDFGYKHDFKVEFGKTKHNLQLSLDVKNILNLFNSTWGVAKYMNPDLNEGRILKYERTDADGYPVFSTPKAVNGNTDTWVYNHAIGQCWYASVGIKYIFN